MLLSFCLPAAQLPAGAVLQVRTAPVDAKDDYQEPGTTAWERADWLHNNDPQALVTAARKAAAATLKKGVTTAIDKGAGGLEYVVADLKKEINAGDIPGPRIFHAWKGIWWYDGFTL